MCLHKQVLKCRDHKTGEVCAVKVIRNQKRFHKQALIEIRILDHLRNQVHRSSPCHHSATQYQLHSINCGGEVGWDYSIPIILRQNVYFAASNGAEGLLRDVDCNWRLAGWY